MLHDNAVLGLLVSIVAQESNCKVKDLRNLGRCPSLCRIRDTVLYLIRTQLKLSYPEIGKVFFGRHHTTIMAAVRREGVRLKRNLFQRPGGPRLSEWHAYLLKKLDGAVADMGHEKERAPSLDEVRQEVSRPPRLSDFATPSDKEPPSNA